MSWTDGELGDFLTLKRGHDLPNGSRQAGEIPVISSSGVTGWHNERKAEPPGVVTGRYGTIGEVFYVDQPYWPLNTALYVIDFKNNDPRFVAYFLREKLKNYQSDKAAVPGVDRKVLHKLPARCPDTQIQQAIVRTLSAYDDLIENNRRRIGLLEEAARQLYKEWFVRFRFPGHEHVKIIDGVPEGWKWKEIGEVADDVSYGYTASADPDVEGPKFLRITDIVKGQISWPDVPQCPITEHKAARFALSKGDVVVARTGATTGWARRIGRIRQPAVFASYLVRFRFGHSLNPVLAAIFMESESYKGMVWAGIGGAAQPNASAQLLAKPKLLVPTEDLQASFASKVEPNFQMIDVLMEQVQNLSLARDLLLPKLMSGAITI